MTPEEINALVNAWAWVDSHGRQLAGITVGLIPACLMPRITRRALARRDRRRGLRRLEQGANCPGSRAILDDFHQPRKEER